MRSGRPTVLDQRKERRALSQAPIDRIQAPAADMAVAIATSAKALQHAVRDHWMLDEQGLVAWQQGWLP